MALYHTWQVAMPALALNNSDGRRVNNINRKARFNMLVFWASWCGPCRKEIPALKKNYKALGQKKSFNMASISVDKDSSAWNKALNDEQMTWPQYRANPKEYKMVSATYNVSGIPHIALLDENGVEIKHYVGFAPGKEDEIIQFIENRM